MIQFAVCLATCLTFRTKKANHTNSKVDTRDGKSVFINHCVLSCAWSIIWGNLAEYYKHKASLFSSKPFPSISVPKKPDEIQPGVTLHLLHIMTANATSSVGSWSLRSNLAHSSVKKASAMTDLVSSAAGVSLDTP